MKPLLVVKKCCRDLIISSDTCDGLCPQKYQNKLIKKAQNPRRITTERKISAASTSVGAKRVGDELGEK